MKLPRSSGILLHPTSLPGKYGIGDFGPGAYSFIDFLEETYQSIWQVLPLGPVGYGNSPYQSSSSFAGNHLLISFDRLLDAEWLLEEDLEGVPDLNDFLVLYPEVTAYNDRVLNTSYERFKAGARPDSVALFEQFNQEQASWLDDYALFAVLSAQYNNRPWWAWAEKYALRDQATLDEFSAEHADQVRSTKYRQWLFYSQWLDVKKYANDRGIQLFGDIPIFVSANSSDVWANQQLFKLEPDGTPTVVAGVPPDYFSETGQRWGNPLYRWDLMKQDNYAWWVERVRATLELVDMVRIDHFRGFIAAWEIPAEEETAIKGEWVPGPGAELFDAMQEQLGENLPLVAEDLGVITEEVRSVRDQFALPGMKIIQFAFDEEEKSNDFLPHLYPNNCVVYTGTHDNDTTLGWWFSVSENVQKNVQSYMGPVESPPLDLMRLAMMSVADTAIFPLQDILGYGTDTRMNRPGSAKGNWEWRYKDNALTDEVRKMLGNMTRRYDRHPGAMDETGD